MTTDDDTADGNPVKPTPNVVEGDEVTASWLTDALRSGGLDTDGQIADFTATVIGTGQVGSNIRFVLEWSGGTGAEPSSIVGKFPSDNAESRATAVATETYVREVGFYEDLSSKVSIRVPEVHYVAMNPGTDNFVLLLEDMTPAVAGDQITGCSVDEAGIAVRSVAGLHSPFWGDDSLADLEWISPRSTERLDELAALYVPMFDEFATRYADRLAPSVLDLGRWFGGTVRTFFDARTTPATLVHGDYRVDNMLFGRTLGADDHWPPPLTVVDWQTVTLGSGPADVAYFLGAGLQPVEREAVEQDMVADYHKRLGDEHGVDVSFDSVWHDYCIGSLSGYFMAVFASMVVGRTDRGDEMFAVMAERHAAQADHLDVRSMLS